MKLNEFINRGCMAAGDRMSSYYLQDLQADAQAILDYLILNTTITRTEASFTFTADDAEIDLSNTSTYPGFRWDALIELRLHLNEQGAWSGSSVSYTKFDGVTHNSKKWRCEQTHTSTSSIEPGESGGSGYWTQVYWFGDEKIEQEDMGRIRHLLNEKAETGKPEIVGWDIKNKGYVWPVPDLAYGANVIYRQQLVSFELGEKSNPTINIDDDILRQAAVYGFPIALNKGRTEIASNPDWQRFRDWVKEINGSESLAPARFAKDFGAYDP